MAAQAAPEGASAIFFTGATQEIFGCVIDRDVSPEAPQKIILLEKIMDDFRNRAGVSDFSAVKKEMQAYKGTEVLVVFDPDFKYGQNFIVFLTDTARENFLKAAEVVTVVDADGVAVVSTQDAPVITVDDEPIEVKPTRPLEWLSLGSENEIESAVAARPKIALILTRRRRYFGGFFRFNDNSTGLLDRGNCIPVDFTSQDNVAGGIKRVALDAATQAVSLLKDSTSQTTWARTANMSTQCCPRVASTASLQNTINNNPEFSAFLTNVTPRMIEALVENTHVDFFANDYHLLHSKEHRLVTANKDYTKLKEHQSFKYLKFTLDMTITCCNWHPAIDGIIAVAYSNKASFDERIESSSRVPDVKPMVLLWSTASPLAPLIILEAPEDIFAVQFNPTEPRIVAGGCLNGQLVLWDLSSQAQRLYPDNAANENLGSPTIRYSVCSAIDGGHKSCITDIKWLPSAMEISKTGKFLNATGAPPLGRKCNQLISLAADGTALIWDLRGDDQMTTRDLNALKLLDLKWNPLLRIFLVMDSEIGGTKISIGHTAKPAPLNAGSTTAPPPLDISGINPFIFVGSEQGTVIYVDWRPPETDNGKLGVQLVAASWDVHGGPVVALKRSPFFSNIILSVGGCSFCIINEKVKSSVLLRSEFPGTNLTDAEWSLTRPGVFFISKKDGSIDCWDLLDSTYGPAFTQTASSSLGIATIALVGGSDRSNKSFLAAGDEGGTLHVLDVPDCFVTPATNEFQSIEMLFEKEHQRILFFEGRSKAVKHVGKAIETAVPKVETAIELAARMKVSYDEYLSEENKFLIALGLRQDAEK